MSVLEFNQTKSIGRGGKRPGAGRKAGAVTKKTREIAEKAVESGLTPLEFMLQIMRQEPQDVEDPRLLQTILEMRFEAAKAAAPYMHPKLSAVEMNAKVTTRSLDQELAELNAANPDAEGDSSLA